MANPEHVEIVWRGQGAIADWQTANAGKAPLDLSGEDFRRADLMGANLSGANLASADLCSVDLRWVNLTGADLSTARLNAANLNGANLWGAILGGANLRRARLVEANLTRAVLSGTDLFEADLRLANLGAADMTGANLCGADLRQADLREAKFNGADLFRADLARADLRGAFLYGVNFDWTNLAGADLRDATVGGAAFSDVELGATKGLDKVRHCEPSPVSTSTLALSQGKIPEVFLRGCGLSEWEIVAARLHARDLTDEDAVTIAREIANARKHQPLQCDLAFISVSHQDSPFALKLFGALQGRGVRCWFNWHEETPHETIDHLVNRELRLWDKVLLCASQSSLTSWWIEGEIKRAFEKEQRLLEERGKRVFALIPIDLDGRLVDDTSQNVHALSIRSRLAAQFKGWERDGAIFDRELENVIRALQRDDARREPVLLPKL